MLESFRVFKGQLTDDSLVVSKGEVRDTSLVKRAVFTDHRPVQGVALLVMVKCCLMSSDVS